MFYKIQKVIKVDAFLGTFQNRVEFRGRKASRSNEMSHGTPPELQKSLPEEFYRKEWAAHKRFSFILKNFYKFFLKLENKLFSKVCKDKGTLFAISGDSQERPIEQFRS